MRVPWNEIVLVDNVELQLEGGGAGPERSDEPRQPINCPAHNYRLLRPQIIATGARKRTRSFHQQQQQVASSQQQSSGAKLAPADNNRLQGALILRDSALVQQTIVLPNSSASTSASNNNNQGSQSEQQAALVYNSRKANEFMSTISVQLTPPKATSRLPDELKLVHLRITIEGNLFERSFEAQQNLSFTYAWNRRNVYKQKSFGLSTALVSIGYEYFDCQTVVWASKHLQLAGHDLLISDIGNQWNLNIHHRYNHRDSILQRGDGQNFNLRAERPLVVQPLMGDGYQRAPACAYCDGHSAQPLEHRLLRPQALLVGPDNSLYVGDHSLIRRMEPTGQRGERLVRTLAELPGRGGSQQAAPKYSLALSGGPEARLHVADQERAQVFYVRERQDYGPLNESSPSASAQDNGALLDSGLVPLVGSGLRCQLSEQAGASDNCGDSGPAREAKLIEPRALVFDLANRMYLADGPNVRVVEPNEQRTIYTLLGDYNALETRDFRFPCQPGASVPVHRFAPRAPSSLALSPLDETLHFLDEQVVYKVGQDKRVQLVAGKPAHCSTAADQQQVATSAGASQQPVRRASEFQFQASVQSIVFNQMGQLLVAEADDESRPNGGARVYLVEPEEDQISVFAGAPLVGASTSGADEQQAGAKLRSTNVLGAPNGNQASLASEYRFQSIGAISVDQRGNLLVAERQQPRVVSVEPDLPQMSAAGEFELSSPENPNELLVFNRFGHQVATRVDQTAGAQASTTTTTTTTTTASNTAIQRNKYTFSYNVNTSFGQLASVQMANGNRLSIYRDGPQHSVKMIETAFGGQCRLEISRQGQVHSLALSSPGGPANRIKLAYLNDGGLLRESRDEIQGEAYEFAYDEFGRAQAITLHSKRLGAPLECRNQLVAAHTWRRLRGAQIGRECSALIA